MHADPIKPTLRAPGTKRLKLSYDGSLSKFAFKFNLRRYTMYADQPHAREAGHVAGAAAFVASVGVPAGRRRLQR